MRARSMAIPLVLAWLLASGGCVMREHVVVREPAGSPAGEEVVVTDAPPAPVTEVITVRPGPAYVWIGGCWIWRNQWVWERGHWALPPRHGAVWVAHRYVYRGGRHIWVRGGWR
jgi:WXXGXW repeat (2 copies)